MRCSGPAGQERADREAHRQPARVHHHPGEDRRDRAAARGEHRQRGELGRAGEDDQRHHDRRERAHHRLREHAEGDAARERRQDQRHARADAGPDIARFVHVDLHLTVYLLVQVVTPTPETIRLQGGSLAIDFANTVDWTEDEREQPDTDALLEPDSLDRWGRRLGVLGRPGDPQELELARGLRAALHHIFSALAREQEPDPFALTRLRFAYAQAVAAGDAQSRATTASFGLDWEHGRAAARALRRRGRRRRAARRPRPRRPPAPLPRPRLRLGLPQHQRPPPLVLDGDLRQPRQDAPDVRAEES